jgi:hypothetical protein
LSFHACGAGFFKNIAELILAKQRNGPTGTSYLAFISQFAKFADLDRDDLSPYLSRFDRSGPQSQRKDHSSQA